MYPVLSILYLSSPSHPIAHYAVSNYVEFLSSQVLNAHEKGTFKLFILPLEPPLRKMRNKSFEQPY